MKEEWTGAPNSSQLSNTRSKVKEDKMNRNRLLNKYLLLALILTALFAMTGCRTRITNNSEVSNVYYDEDGFLSETYQMRRDELGLSTAESPIFPDLGGGETADDFDSSEETGLNYEPEEDTYVEPPTTSTTTTSSSSGRRYSSPSSSGSGNRSSSDTVKIYLHGEGGTIDGNKSITMSVKKNEKTTLPGNNQATGSKKIKRDGYKFKGWSKKPEDKNSIVDFEFKTSDNINLYAIWEKDNSREKKTEITVTFDPDGGTVDKETATVKTGEKYANLPKPSKTGFEFKGWYTEKNGKGEKIDSSKVCNKTKNITLFAYWKKLTQKYKIEFNANGGDESFDPIEVDEGGNYKFPKIKPTRNGYEFDGWYTEAEGGKKISTGDSAKGNQTLYAHWNAYKYWNKEASNAIKGKEINCFLYKGKSAQQNLITSCNGNLVEAGDNPDVVIAFADRGDEQAVAEALRNDNPEITADVYIISTKATTSNPSCPRRHRAIRSPDASSTLV